MGQLNHCLVACGPQGFPEEGRDRAVLRERESGERIKELVNAIVRAGKSEICKAGQQAGCHNLEAKICSLEIQAGFP